MRTIFILSLFVVVGCSDPGHRNVGDIQTDPSIDAPGFTVCNERNIKQHYVRHSSDTAPVFDGEKSTMDKIIYNAYNYPIQEDQNGYITIRFILNCHGETGRFRVEEMDESYTPLRFDSRISNQLLEIVKGLDGWTPRKSETTIYDTYHYITFKIRHGQIAHILP